jgi:ABC-type arginine transport system permease subunit
MLPVYARFEVLEVVTINVAVFLHVTSPILKMEAGSLPETLLTIYETTQRSVPDDSNIYIYSIYVNSVLGLRV